MRKILLCVSGTTPQIITETIYALAVLRDPPFIPHEIHVITTSIGRDFILENLLNTEQGYFYKLIKNYEIPKPKFDLQTIHVIGEGAGEVIDIVDDRVNKLTAAFILQTVKDLCVLEENQVHASIAGGRKTMGLFLGMGMQFFGKEIDEMSHVLVSPPFESHPDFYYPPNPPKIITVYDSRQGKYHKLCTSEAKITLANIPFIRLNLVEDFKKDLELNLLVDIAQKKIQECVPVIEVSESDLSITISRQKLYLTPVERAIYFFMLNNKLQCTKDVCEPGCRECYVSPGMFNLHEILDYYRKILGNCSQRVERFEASLNKMDVRSWFLQHRSRINKKLRGVDFTCKSLIQDYGAYGTKIYGIDVPKERIFIKY